MASKENINPMEYLRRASIAIDESANRHYNAWHEKVEATSQWMDKYFEDAIKKLKIGNNSNQELVPKTLLKKNLSDLKVKDQVQVVITKAKDNSILEQEEIFNAKLKVPRCDEDILRLSPDTEEETSRRSRLSSSIKHQSHSDIVEQNTSVKSSSLPSLNQGKPSVDNESTSVRRSKRFSKSSANQDDSTGSSNRLSFKKPAKPCPVRKTRSTRLSKKGAAKTVDRSLNALDSISSGNESETASVPVEKPPENKKWESTILKKQSYVEETQELKTTGKNPVHEMEITQELPPTIPSCKVSLERLDEETYRRVSGGHCVSKSDDEVIVHPTPMVGKSSPTKPRNGIRPSLTMRAFSPKSPRQLFSPYSPQSVKNKASAFENLATPINSQIRKINPQTVVIKPAIPSPLKEINENVSPNTRSRKSREGRKSLSKDLILAKVDRMSISKRRSSRVRISMHAVKNQIFKEVIEKRKSILENEHPAKASDDRELPAKAESSDSEYESATDDEDIEMKNKKRNKNSSSAEKKLKRTNSFVTRSIPKVHYPQSLPKNLTTSRVAFFNSLGTKQGGSAGKLCTSISRAGNKSATSPAIIQKMKESWFKEEIEKKKQREKAAYAKKEQLLKEKMVLSKKKNEEKQLKVLEKRQQLFKAKEERKRTIELKQEQHAARKQAMEEKRREELEKKKKDELAAKLRIQAIKEAQLEEQKKIEAAAFAEEQKQASSTTSKSKYGSITSLDKTEKSEKPIPKPLAITKQALNETFNAAETSETSQYDITPHHSEMAPQKLVDPDNYNINDLKSDDDTDDESAPRKQIPSWAQGTKLHMLVRKQTMMIKNGMIDVEELFPLLDIMKEFNLADVFSIHRRRFFNRTSSAVWHVPPSLSEGGF